MSFLESLRQKPHHQKVKIVWIVLSVVVIGLVTLWVFTSKIGNLGPKDTSLFKTFGDGVKDVREQYKK